MRRKRTTGGLTVNAVAGTHVVLLGLDLAEAQRRGCLGFAIQREDHTEHERYWLSGTKTFKETDPGLGPGGHASPPEIVGAHGSRAASIRSNRFSGPITAPSRSTTTPTR